jgi:hypothetical protein
MTFKMNDDVEKYLGGMTSGTFEAMTGKCNATYSSYSGKTMLTFYNGGQTYVDSYLAEKTGSDITYKGVSYFLMKQGFVGDNVSAVPNYSCVVRRTQLISGWDKQQIGNDVNPAAALYYILSVMIGYPADMLDEQSFRTANNTLYGEGLGISFLMNSASEAKQYIDEILKTIDGVLQVDSQSGQMRLKLLRGDYDINTIPYVSESNSNDITFSRRGNEELSSRVTVKYNLNKDNQYFMDSSLTATNTAARLMLGYEKTQSVEFMMITSEANAKKVLDNTFKKYSYPLAAMKFTVSAADFGNLRVGDVVNFNNKNLGIENMAIRITSIGGDSDKAQKLEIEGGEDIFSLGSMVVVSEQGSEAKEIDFSIAPIQYADAKDAPPETALTRSVIPLVAYPAGIVQSVEVTDGGSGETMSVPNCYLTTLSAAYPITDMIDETAGFKVSPISELWNVALTNAGFQRLKGSAYIGNELIGYQFRTRQADGGYWVENIIRGVANTPITAHAVGERVWFIDVDGNDFPSLPIISPTPSLSFRARNMRNYTDSFVINHNYKFSVETPYPAGNLTATRDGATITLTWTPSVRLAGANYRNADNIVGGQDEGMQEGEWLVEWSGGSATTAGLSFSRDDTVVRQYSVTTVLNGYKSKTKTITI